MKIVLTDHAVKRYRQRADSSATRAGLEEMITGAEVRTDWKGHNGDRGAAAYCVVPAGAFLLHRAGSAMVATTFLPTQRRSKAERRAYREELREAA